MSKEASQGSLSKQVPSASRNNAATTKVGDTVASGNIVSVTYSPAALVTVKTGESRGLVLRNKTQGTVAAQKSLAQAGMIAAGTPIPIILNVTGVNPGDELEWTSAPGSVGFDDPGGTVTVTY